VLALEAVTADDVDDMLATVPAAERDRREETGAARALVDGADRLVSALDAVGRS
jgi:hypothetical protein